MVLRCRSCDAEYPLSEFADSVDDFLERRLANIPCDRL
ncbi:MAG: dual CXXC motif small (seleno)protein [Deltaproteobacteria bacterium]